MHRLHPNKHLVVVLLLMTVAALSLHFPVARAAIHAAPATGYLLSTPDPISIDVARGETTQRGAHAIPTSPPTPRATPVKPSKPTPEPIRKPVLVARPHSGHTLLWPVHGTITTYFSLAHPAIDIAAAQGTPVHAACSGRVIYAGWKLNGGGNVVDILCTNGMVTSYNHLSTILVGVGSGVNAGALIARVGMTGRATGPHLHFAVIVGGRFVNPLAYL
jgi:murein DD-endopeptidase MepM/ murein hydrolase activator NlpD